MKSVYYYGGNDSTVVTPKAASEGRRQRDCTGKLADLCQEGESLRQSPWESMILHAYKTEREFSILTIRRTLPCRCGRRLSQSDSL